MKRVLVPLTPAMAAALASLAQARRALQRRRGRSPGQLGDRESPVQSVTPDKQRREEDPAPGREDTDKPTMLEGLGNAGKAGAFTSRCRG